MIYNEMVNRITFPRTDKGLVSLALFGAVLLDWTLGGLLHEALSVPFASLVSTKTLLLPIFVLAGEGSCGSCGTGADNGISISVQSTSVSVTDNATGVTYSGTMDAMGNFSCDNGMSFGGIGEPSSGGPSTPFLRVWDGRSFKLENDFLFGKPNTAFLSKEVGMRKYESGAIGGDTYILRTTPVASDGVLKMQIREIEPEESYIDSLSIHVVDLAPSEYLVADGNLKESHVFDRDRTRTVSDENVQVSRVGMTTPTVTRFSYNRLGKGYGRGQFLNTGDELILRVPKIVLDKQEDLFVLLDSHYRDWTLGNDVPFSRLERLGIAAHMFLHSSLGLMAGLAVFGGGLFGSMVREGGIIPYTYADTPHTGGSSGGTGGWTGGRSLVVTVRDGSKSLYLETIFPRYAQASQEVVRIPRDFLSALKSEFFTVHIRATKKHKVRAAFVFAGEAMVKAGQPLKLVSAFHERLQADVSDRLAQKDSRYLETIPGDVVSLSWKDTPGPSAGETRKYVLKADGFYTRLSEYSKRVIGKDWYQKLASQDKKILRSFKRQQSV